MSTWSPPRREDLARARAGARALAGLRPAWVAVRRSFGGAPT